LKELIERLNFILRLKSNQTLTSIIVKYTISYCFTGNLVWLL